MFSLFESQKLSVEKNVDEFEVYDHFEILFDKQYARIAGLCLRIAKLTSQRYNK